MLKNQKLKRNRLLAHVYKVFSCLVSLRLSRISKVSGVFILMGFLMGYQPTFAIPPIKQSIARAEYTQTQTIQAGSFSQTPQLPHQGYLTTHFSAWHPGVDIATGLGTPVRPILKGRVVDIEYTLWGLGHYVVVEHEQGLKSTYGHMDRIYMKVGDEVDQSTILGTVGVTGWTSGPHTHLEVKKDDVYINPETILPNIPDFEAYAKNLATSN